MPKMILHAPTEKAVDSALNDACVSHATRYAERCAELAVGYIRQLEEQMGIMLGDEAVPQQWPLQFMLEAGAIQLIAEWEESGARMMMDIPLPSAEELMDDLHARFIADPAKHCQGSSGISFLVNVSWHWFMYVAEPSVNGLNIDIVASEPVFDDEAIDSLAKLLIDYLELADKWEEDEC